MLLSQGPQSMAKKFKGYISNGYRFCTMEKEKSSKSQNSGVVVKASTTSYASTKDKNPITSYMSFYGRLTDVVELAYSEQLRHVLFKCDWVDIMTQGRGIKTDELGFTLVNFKRLLYTGQHVMDDPFVFASQAEQVFFVVDPIDEEWNVVVKTKPRDLFELITNDDQPIDCEPYATQLVTNNEEEVDGLSWAREDVPGTTVDAHSHTSTEQLASSSDPVHDEQGSDSDDDHE